MEDVEVLELLAVGGEHHGPAGDVSDRERGTAAGVAVELGEHHAVEADTVPEGFGRGDGVLTDHRVDDEEDLVRLHRIADVGRLLHHLGVDTQPAGGVDDHDVVQLGAGVLDASARHVDRVADTAAGFGCEDRDPGAFADDLELLDGIGALQVGRHEQGLVTLRLQPAAELAREGGLTGTLQAGEHDDGRRSLGEPQPARVTAEDLDELLVDDLDDLLGRVEGLVDVGAAGAFPELGDEGTHDRQRDVGLQQRDPDLPRAGIEVSVGEPALAAEPLERRLEAILKCREHGGSLVLARRGGVLPE